jgi:putative DNA primase/helicase
MAEIRLARAALAYASLGWPVFPVRPLEKTPQIKAWREKATADPKQIRSWWRKFPEANIGIVTGQRSGLVVVDIDPKNGGDFHDFRSEFGNFETPIACTPSGGLHVYFKLPINEELQTRHDGCLGRGVDFQAEGAYVVAPPSQIQLAEGPRDYAWDQRPLLPHHEGGVPIALLPPALIMRLRTKTTTEKRTQTMPEKIIEGGRNDFLARVAGSLRRKGLQEAEILAALRETNRIRCVPPLPEEEVQVIARSIGRYPAEDPIPAETITASTDPCFGESLHQMITRLAALSHVEYDRVRKSEAERLGVNVTALDADVRAVRQHAQKGNIGGSSAEPRTVEPWPEPVNGADLLAALANRFRKHVILPDHAAETLALWVLHTHTFESATFSPLLLLTSPEKRCGKTTVISLLQRLTSKPMSVSNITAAALFRSVELWKPTLLIDEADSFMKDNEELRGIVNSGHTKKSAYVTRVEGENHEPRCFSTWCPKAIAGIGRQAGTIHDRSIEIRMRRRRPDETVAKLRERTDVSEFGALARKCARWALDALETLSGAEPIEPPGLDDRQADNWEPLLAIADLACGEWPARARSAALALSGVEETDEDISVSVLLLADIRQIFDELQTDRVTTATLIERLGEIQEHPWATFDHGKIINPRLLAKLLKSFEISSQDIRTDDQKTLKGYKKADFQDAFERYLEKSRKANIYPLHPLHDSQQMTSVADLSATVADLLRKKNEANSFNNCYVADKDRKRGEEYKEKMVSRPEELQDELAAKYRAHVRECLFCAIEEGEVVELCPDGKELFDAYLQAHAALAKGPQQTSQEISDRRIRDCH